MDTYQDWGVDLSGEQSLGQALTIRGKLFYHGHNDEYVSFGDQDYTRKIATTSFNDYFMGLSLLADWQAASQFTLRGLSTTGATPTRRRPTPISPMPSRSPTPAPAPWRPGGVPSGASRWWPASATTGSASPSPRPT